jgi:hypothetical protein
VDRFRGRYEPAGNDGPDCRGICADPLTRPETALCGTGAHPVLRNRRGDRCHRMARTPGGPWRGSPPPHTGYPAR